MRLKPGGRSHFPFRKLASNNCPRINIIFVSHEKTKPLYSSVPPSDQDPNNIVTTVFHKPCKQTVLTKTTVLSPKPVIFTAPVRNLSFSVVSLYC